MTPRDIMRGRSTPFNSRANRFRSGFSESSVRREDEGEEDETEVERCSPRDEFDVDSEYRERVLDITNSVETGLRKRGVWCDDFRTDQYGNMAFDIGYPVFGDNTVQDAFKYFEGLKNTHLTMYVHGIEFHTNKEIGKLLNLRPGSLTRVMQIGSIGVYMPQVIESPIAVNAIAELGEVVRKIKSYAAQQKREGLAI